MNKMGIIEGFFGPQWPNTARESYADFLSRYGGDFYIYAPKQDSLLRKKWRDPWETDYVEFLRRLKKVFQLHQIKFGVGFSPFGLGASLLASDIGHLKLKLNILNDLQIDLLGLFFDDMPTNEFLAKTQIAALEVIRQSFQGKIIFCPSYYTPDPILDKVFGQRPTNYLEDIANGVPEEVSIAWTGPQVISSEITSEHLSETAAILKRKPFLWENIFANDGPRNCKFLKMRNYTGRSPESLEKAEGLGLNMMNQPELSKILYLSSRLVLRGESDPEKAFEDALSSLASPGFKDFILLNRDKFLNQGFDSISDEEKSQLIQELHFFADPGAIEISDWLQGKYNVGSECLTD